MKKTSRSIRSAIIDRPVLISGIQPTGRLHLGNYLGAVKNFVELQNSGKYQCYFFVADYHSLTQDAENIGKNSLDLVLNYLAAGLDPKKSVIFLQSAVHHSPELAWIFETLTSLGDLYRMTQFKERSALRQAQGKAVQNAGLLTYPTLMAADILLFDAQIVPVGEDQLQHLELAREIARKFNNKFGEIFPEPKPILSKIPRLMSLDNPAKKMSKSLPAGCLFIDDSAADIAEKIKQAVTDSGTDVRYDPVNKPAISNLLTIYSELSGETMPQLEREFIVQNYSQFKTALAKLVTNYFKPLNLRKTKLQTQTAKVKKIIAAGNKKAHEIAKKKMAEVKAKIGLLIS